MVLSVSDGRAVLPISNLTRGIPPRGVRWATLYAAKFLIKSLIFFKIFGIIFIENEEESQNIAGWSNGRILGSLPKDNSSTLFPATNSS